MEVERGQSAVYELAYHVVWCPKYRKKLPLAVFKTLRILILAICETKGWTVKELNIREDHVHLFLGTTPMDSPVSVVKSLKGTTAKLLSEQHPILRTMFRHGHLWSPSYYIGTVGHVSEETVARYIREQKERTVGRPRLRASSPQ